MKKMFCCFFVIVMASALWGCAELDLDSEPVEPVESVQEVQAAPEGSVEAQQPGDEFIRVEPEAYYSCEGKRCGEPCAPGGYVCNIMGECSKSNPACD